MILNKVLSDKCNEYLLAQITKKISKKKKKIWKKLHQPYKERSNCYSQSKKSSIPSILSRSVCKIWKCKIVRAASEWKIE